MDKQHPFYVSLEHSVDLSHQLEQALADETQAIERRNAEQLQSVVAIKKELVAYLERETLQQRDIVEASGQPFTPQGLHTFLTTLDDHTHALVQYWKKLRQSITRCSTMNKTNAQLIERQRQRVAATIRLLRGDDGSGGLYTHKGRTSAITVQRRTLSLA